MYQAKLELGNEAGWSHVEASVSDFVRSWGTYWDRGVGTWTWARQFLLAIFSQKVKPRSFQVLHVFCPFQLLLQILISFKLLYCKAQSHSSSHNLYSFHIHAHYLYIQFKIIPASRPGNNNNVYYWEVCKCDKWQQTKRSEREQTWKFHFDNNK